MLSFLKFGFFILLAKYVRSQTIQKLTACPTNKNICSNGGQVFDIAFEYFDGILKFFSPYSA
jgi:hypothetical protein